MAAVTLKEHLSNLQDTALLAETLLSALLVSVHRPDRVALSSTLVETAHDLLKDLGSALDVVNLPKGVIE